MKLVECPRDAMQGLKTFIPTERKAVYLNQLLKVGFDTLDFGSFVSPKAIPQMRDTAAVLNLLNLDQTNTKLLAIVANRRGAVDAVAHDEITYLGYPFSISETFQMRNTNATIEESLVRVADIQELCIQYNKTMVVYISMGFGNPYGDPWNVEIVDKWTARLASMGIKILQLSDTIGVSNKESISYLFGNLLPNYPDIEIGAHLHTEPSYWQEKIIAAYENGCRRFDGAIRGYGGCPMAKDDLTGNMPMENMVHYFNQHETSLQLNQDAFLQALRMADDVFLFRRE
ncbi:MAG: hydroxymethylglutaryl-CoA lyase [Bacteroidota bacterium]